MSKERTFVETKDKAKICQITVVAGRCVFPDDFSLECKPTPNYSLEFEEPVNPRLIHQALIGFPGYTLQGHDKRPVRITEVKDEKR